MKFFSFLLVAGFLLVVLADPLNYDVAEANFLAEEERIVSSGETESSGEADNGSGYETVMGSEYIESPFADDNGDIEEFDVDDIEDDFDVNDAEEEEELPSDLKEETEYEEEQRELEDEDVDAAEESEVEEAPYEQRSELEGEFDSNEAQDDEIRSVEDLLDEAEAVEQAEDESDSDVEQQDFEEARDIQETDETEKENYERELQELTEQSETAENYEDTTEQSFEEQELTESDNAEKRKRFLWTWGWKYRTLLRRVTGKWSSLKGYGCYCGSAGKGNPVDEIDKCCQVRQECNENRNKTYTVNGLFGKKWTFKCDRYTYSCRGPAIGKMNCKCTNRHECPRAACACQLKFAECVKKNMKVYDEENVDISDTCK